MIAPIEVCPCMAVLIDPLKANGKPAPGHCWSPIGGHLQIEVEIVLHDVNAVVPVQWIVQHNRVRLFDWVIFLCRS